MVVNILRSNYGWILSITGNGVSKYVGYLKLIDAIDAANILMVHVDNIRDLPLGQYKEYL